MNDLRVLLENRTDLEKLEQDLLAIEILPESRRFDEDFRELIRKAHQDLETARAAHIRLVFRLSDPAALERATSRQELQDRINTGELKVYNPHTETWLPATKLLIQATQWDKELDRRAVEIRQVEEALADLAKTVPNLQALRHLIRRAEELEREEALSFEGKAALQSARHAYHQGCERHREITLKVHHGSLKERTQALQAIKDLIREGETRILDAPAGVWRESDQMLALAEQEIRLESARSTDDILANANTLAATHLNAAVNALYKALDQSIPYVEADRNRLQARYLELLDLLRQKKAQDDQEDQPAPIDPTDLQGYKIVYELHQLRLKDLFNRSAEWLNQFFHSSITRPVAQLLDEAASAQTTPARTVELIDMAIGLAVDTMEGSIEIPETMVRGAVILFRKEMAERAFDLLIEARPLYTLERADKIHRHAVTAWLSGCVAYYLNQRLSGYSEWKIARNLFHDLLLQMRLEKQVAKANWYKERLIEMERYSIQTYEEAYFQWMNEFDPITLSAGLTEYHQLMDAQLGAEKIPELRKTIRLFLQASRREMPPDMYPLALVEAAFYEYQQRDLMAAIIFLKDAWVGFQASHRGGVTLWLLGMIRWWLPSQRTNAMINWEDSIRIFRNLAKQSDAADEQNKRAWYEAQAELMQVSLQQWIILTQPR